MNKRPIRICGTEDQSLRYEARLPLPNRPLAQFPLSELSISNGNASFRAEGMGFDLAADFLYSIVIPVDVMTVQTSICLAPEMLICNSLKSIMLGV